MQIPAVGEPKRVHDLLRITVSRDIVAGLFSISYDLKGIQTCISLHTTTCTRPAECRKNNNQHACFHALLKRRLRTTSLALKPSLASTQSLLIQNLNLANPLAMLIGSRTKPSPAKTLAFNNSLVSRLKIGMRRRLLPKPCWREATTSSTLTGLD